MFFDSFILFPFPAKRAKNFGARTSVRFSVRSGESLDIRRRLAVARSSGVNAALQNGFRRGWSSTGSGVGGGCARVLRGGSWNHDDPENLRASYRNNNHPGNRNNNVGFRVVCVVVSARKVLSQAGNRWARCGVGEAPAPPVPRSHLTARATPHAGKRRGAGRGR